jgi:hypothetical protein
MQRKGRAQQSGRISDFLLEIAPGNRIIKGHEWRHLRYGRGRNRLTAVGPFGPKGAAPMMSSWRIGLFLSLAILGGRTAADAQTRSGRPASGPAAGATAAPATSRAASASTTAAVAAATRRQPSLSFNRVATTGRGSVSASSRGMSAGRGLASSGAISQGDPLRSYSPRVREASSSISSTRPQEAPRVIAERPVQSYNYYPGMRTGQHPNANTAQIRGSSMGIRHCTPSRSQFLAGAGRGR